MLVDLLEQWKRTTDMAERTAVWRKMLDLYSEQVFSIGIVNSALQPVFSTTRMRNLPEQGLYSFNPTSYLGVYRPDAFWLAGDR